MVHLCRVGLRPGIGGGAPSGQAQTPQIIGLVNQGALTFARSVNLCLNAAITRAYLCSTVNTHLAIIDITNPSNLSPGLPIIGTLTFPNGINSGVLTDDERYLFVASESGARVTTVDLIDEANPVIVASLTLATELAGAANITRDGNTLFVSTITRNSVALVDCTNPLSLSLISEMRGPTPGTSFSSCRDCVLDRTNKIAYAAAEGRDAVQIFGYGTLASPNFILEVRDTTNLNAVRGLHLRGNYLYAAVADGVSAAPRGALTTLNVSVPASASIINTVLGTGTMTSNTSFAGSRGVKSYGNYLVTSNELSSSICTWNIIDPTAPVKIVQTQGVTKGVDYNAPMGVALFPYNGTVIALITMFTTNSLNNKALVAVDTKIPA